MNACLSPDLVQLHPFRVLHIAQKSECTFTEIGTVPIFELRWSIQLKEHLLTCRGSEFLTCPSFALAVHHFLSIAQFP